MTYLNCLDHLVKELQNLNETNAVNRDCETAVKRKLQFAIMPSVSQG